MNSIKCPQCGLVNWGTPPSCKRCGVSFEGISADAFVSIPAGEQVYAPGFQAGPTGALSQEETERTRKVWKWFTVYCSLMALLYVAIAIGSGALLLFNPGSMSRTRDGGELQIQAIVFLLMSAIFAPVYATGLFLKGKSWGWIYGIILIAIGMTSCCLWPITIPLLIQWIKPEMKRMFGQT
ncbi:MAG TPA: hypothetical protein VGX92_01975 [Pyrinomonadaceae bacterium]|jgi:hypothetical protein|nr:hypothetical protein [Pyrinomonadaceae bacterium]